MIRIQSIVNSVFNSMTYIIYKEGLDQAWLIDIGDIEPVISFMIEHNMAVRGVFLTHAHFDHIYGLRLLMDSFCNCSVFCTDFSKTSLVSPKLNLSKYHGTPYSYDGNVTVVRDGDQINLYENEPFAHLYETPGHDPGCLTIVIGDMIFTGDAYIPGLKVNTTLPHANKERANKSLSRIISMSEGKIVFPGHFVD